MSTRPGWLCPAALFLACGLSACATPGEGRRPQQPALAVDAVTIRNELPYAVSDVMIEVPATGAFAGCGTVLPRSECSNRFQQVDYRANPMRVSWRERGKPHSTPEMVLDWPEDLDPDLPARVEVTIFAAGQAGARLRQP